MISGRYNTLRNGTRLVAQSPQATLSAQSQIFVRGHPHNSSSLSRPSTSCTRRRTLLGTSAIAAAAAAVAFDHFNELSTPVYNDAQTENGVSTASPNPIFDIIAPTKRTQQEQMYDRSQRQGVYAWGSNRYNVVAPDAPMMTLVKMPRSIPYFAGMALRDVVLEEKHGVAVDANGDVVQWGLGFFDPSSRLLAENLEEAPLGRRREKEKANELSPRGTLADLPRDPIKTLVGKDIVKIAANDEKVFALSRKGDVYVFSAIRQLQVFRGARKPWSANPVTLFGTWSQPEIDYAKLSLAPSVSLTRGDSIADIATGTSHLTALTKAGRVFSLPTDYHGNVFGQLGSRRVLLNSPWEPDSKPSLVEAIMEPRLLSQMYDPEQPDNATLLPLSGLPSTSLESDITLKPQPQSAGTATDPAPPPVPLTEPPSSIRFCTTLSEIPSLRQVVIADIAIGNEHCLARTSEGRVLAWGRHTHGQLGLGTNFSIECIPVPSEVVLAKSFSSSSRDVHCTGLAAGGDNSFFVTERTEDGRLGNGKSIDVLAAGKGQWGTLGNAMWSQVKPDPTRVKTVSGLMECESAPSHSSLATR